MPFRNADEWGEMLVAESDTVHDYMTKLPGRTRTFVRTNQGFWSLGQKAS